MSIVTPVVNKPFLYETDSVVSYTSTTTLTIPAGRFRDPSNSNDLVLPTNFILNMNGSGINGLDTGTVAANTWYAVAIIFDELLQNPIGTIAFSMANQVPFLPFGYGMYRVIHYILTNGSSQIIPFDIIGTRDVRTNRWRSALATNLSAGTATTFTTVTVNGGVPPIPNTYATFDLNFTPVANGSYVQFRLNGETATQVDEFSGSTAAVIARGQIKLLTSNNAAFGLGQAALQYQNSAAACSTTAFVRSFEYNI